MKIYFNAAMIFLLLAFMGTEGVSQNQIKKEYKVTISSGMVNIADIDGLVVEAYDGNEVVVSTMMEVSEQNDRAKGLKLINSLGLDDNTGFGISVTQEGTNLNIRQMSRNCTCNEVTVKVPRKMKVSINHNNHDAEKILVKNVSSELEITTNYHHVTLENVTGPMAVKTVYGPIEAKFNSVSQVGSVSLYSVYDLVDVSIPTSAAMNLTLTASNGNIYSNVNIGSKKENSKSGSDASCNSGQTISGTVNGGGVEFVIKSAYDDVYLRTK